MVPTMYCPKLNHSYFWRYPWWTEAKDYTNYFASASASSHAICSISTEIAPRQKDPQEHYPWLYVWIHIWELDQSSQRTICQAKRPCSDIRVFILMVIFISMIIPLKGASNPFLIFIDRLYILIFRLNSHFILVLIILFENML